MPDLIRQARNRDGDLNARSHPPSMAAQQFLPGLPDRALRHGRYHTSRSRHENTRCGDAFFSPKSEIEVSVPKQAQAKQATNDQELSNGFRASIVR